MVNAKALGHDLSVNTGRDGYFVLVACFNALATCEGYSNERDIIEAIIIGLRDNPFLEPKYTLTIEPREYPTENPHYDPLPPRDPGAAPGGEDLPFSTLPTDDSD